GRTWPQGQSSDVKREWALRAPLRVRGVGVEASRRGDAPEPSRCNAPIGRAALTAKSAGSLSRVAPDPLTTARTHTEVAGRAEYLATATEVLCSPTFRSRPRERIRLGILLGARRRGVRRWAATSAAHNYSVT